MSGDSIMPQMNENVFALYVAVRNSNEPMINSIQMNAVEMLGNLAIKGDKDASIALQKLLNSPGLHPHLKEKIRYFTTSTDAENM